MRLGVIGLGIVGGALAESLRRKGEEVVGYDSFKESDPFEAVLDTSIVFLALPTPYSEAQGEYDKSALLDVCDRLERAGYGGLAVIKSTVEPGVTDWLAERFPGIRLAHNPEFLTARTALEDSLNQSHIVIGGEANDLVELYRRLFPLAKISQCERIESEMMKIAVNSFYATKIQFFNEIYDLCQRAGASYGRVREMMLANGWINPMHTSVPGPDGRLSYGGACFPKDTNALLKYMEHLGAFRAVLGATVAEHDQMRAE